MVIQGNSIEILERDLQELKIKLKAKDKQISKAQSERALLSREFKTKAKLIKFIIESI